MGISNLGSDFGLEPSFLMIQDERQGGKEKMRLATGAVCSQTNIGIEVIVVWLDQVFARCVIHMAHNIALWLMLFFVLFCLLLRLIHSFHSARLSLAFSTQFHGTQPLVFSTVHQLVFGRLLPCLTMVMAHGSFKQSALLIPSSQSNQLSLASTVTRVMCAQRDITRKNSNT